jgi:glycine betaine/proline transport system permease protein
MDFLNSIPVMDRTALRELKKGIDLSFKEFSRAYGDGIESFFDPLLYFLIWLEKLLVNSPWPLVIGAFALMAWIGSRSIKLVIGTVICFLVIGYFGMWKNCMATVAIISVSTLVCIVVGIPIGVLMSKSSKAEKTILPVLDMMQTIPSFVYLIPIIMLLGIGKVPGLLAVCIYALPPVVRLTNLGIREVDKETLEASEAFGATPMQKLKSVQIPLSLPTIFAGINQTIIKSIGQTLNMIMIIYFGIFI